VTIAKDQFTQKSIIHLLLSFFLAHRVIIIILALTLGGIRTAEVPRAKSEADAYIGHYRFKHAVVIVVDFGCRSTVVGIDTLALLLS
jgi:hypothetical protein